MQTTIVPLILMFIINLAVLIYKLGLSPLRFLRRDLARSGKKRAFRLRAGLPIMHRFRLRVIFQNIPGYITLFLGIFLGGALVVFGLMFGPLLQDYSNMVVDTRIADYQYVVTDTDAETGNASAEKYAMTSLKTTDNKYMEDEVSIFGIVEESAYIHAEIPSGQVLVSNGVMDKFKLESGDVITLKNSITGRSYDFSVAGQYTYDAALSVFMPIEEYRDLFGEEQNYFTGYFSNEKLDDLADEDVAAVITETDLTKLATQMEISMGDMMQLMAWFGVIMFLLLMYILSKQIIEKNTDAIAMVKILGFRSEEIGGLYIAATSIVVIISLLVSIPLIARVMNWAMKDYIYTEMTGYLPCIISNSCYVKMFVMGVVSYAVVSVLQIFKIRRIPKAEALKNME